MNSFIIIEKYYFIERRRSHREYSTAETLTRCSSAKRIFSNYVENTQIDYLGKLNIEEFWEAIVRCAQVAYRNVDTNMVNKLKELFVNMSHKIDTSISNSVNFTGHRDVSTNGKFYY